MEERQKQPNFAFRVLIFKDGKVLLGKNLGAFAPGKFGPPGGHLEYRESFADCLKRETAEECGVTIDNIKFHSIVNIMEGTGPYHNIHVMFTADWKSGEPKVLEPEKCESWDWYDLNNLPTSLFKNIELSLKNWQNPKNCFDLEK